MDSTSRKVIITLGLAAVSVFFLAGMVSAFPCREEPTLGDSLEEVASNCGAATLQDHREGWEELSDGKTTSRRTEIIEEWTFDAGPEELMRTFIFQSGKLAEVRSVGYGKVRDLRQDICRNGEALAVGDTMVDAYLKCGDPLGKEQRQNRVTESKEGQLIRRSSVSVVEWTYRYGRDLPGYTVHFENGIAVDIRTREFGK